MTTIYVLLPEWLSTEDWQLGKGEEAGVDGQAELYGQLGRHHAGQDECTLQEQLVSVPAIAKISSSLTEEKFSFQLPLPKEKDD